MRDAKGSVFKIVSLSLFLAVWLAALLGVLRCGPYLGDLGHSVCGPWGCGPPTEALIVFHGFWLVLLGGAALLAVAFWKPSTLSVVGASLFFLGFGVAIAIAGWELEHLTARTRPLAFQRIGFVFVTMVDVPLFQTTLVGALFWLAGRTKRGRASRRSAENEANTAPLAPEAIANKPDETSEFTTS